MTNESSAMVDAREPRTITPPAQAPSQVSLLDERGAMVDPFRPRCLGQVPMERILGGIGPTPQHGSREIPQNSQGEL